MTLPKLIVVWDTETTAYTPDNGCVWSLGAVAIRDGEVQGEFESLVRPQPHFFQEHHKDVIRRVSGLPENEIENLLLAPTPNEAMESFGQWLNGHVPDCYAFEFTSYNAPFDRRFLESHPLVASEYAMTMTGFEMQWGRCLMEASKQAMGLRKWPKLVDACRHFEVPFEESHRALSDARAAASLALKVFPHSYFFAEADKCPQNLF